VFCTRQELALDAANVRRSFRLVASAAGLNPKEWTPRELRHSFVSLLSSSGVTIEEIAHFVGHGSTSVTERVYRKELRPVITRGARAINELFDATPSDRPTVWPTGQRSNRHTRGQDRKNMWLTRAFFVGDTGFEPVTSSVSAKVDPPCVVYLRRIGVRGRTPVTGYFRSHW
jgi:Phage integrase family